jgi:hypothetical protein
MGELEEKVIFPILKAISPEGPFKNDFGIVCPVCGDFYVRVVNQKIIRPEDGFKAWDGNGSCAKVLFQGECESLFCLCFGFHSGNTTAFVELLFSCKDVVIDD